MDQTYRVAIRGVREGFARDVVIGELAALFKKKPEEIRPLLDARAVVKKGVALAVANKYREALESRGCACAVEAEAVPAAGEAGVSAMARGVEDAATAPCLPAGAQSASARVSEGAPQGLGLQLQPMQAKVAAPADAVVSESPAPGNYYAAPGSAVADSVTDDETVREVAKFQRRVLLSIGASFFANGLMRVGPGGPLTVLLMLGIAIFSIWSIYRLCRALELSAILWVIVMFIPLFNLLGMLYVNQKATRFLKDQGLSVGLLGAKI